MLKLILLLLASFQPADAEQITVKEGEPIVITAAIPTPKEGSKTRSRIRWRSRDALLSYRIFNDGTTVCCWAPIGKYELEGQLITIDFEKQDFDVVDLISSITVEPRSPSPTPTPTPVPPTPTPTPTPEPTPSPTPTPTPTPTPEPAPIPSLGLRVLFVYEQNDLFSMPLAQREILISTGMRKYLDEVCVRLGNKPEYRLYDQNQNTDGESPIWRAAMARPRASVPWLVVSNGKAGWEGPLPANVAATKAIIDRYR